jgi:hypothetical protein
VARAFRRKGARIVARLDDDERGVVVWLLKQTYELLAPQPREPTGDAFDDLVSRMGLPRLNEVGDETAVSPRDPALERLLPPAHRDDPELAAEFRRFTEHGLREGKAANLATAIAALLDSEGDKVWLDQEQAQATVVALTDARLLLGERLGLRSDEDADALQDRLEAASPDDPQLYVAACYDFLTWLQESLIQALMGT